MEALKEGSTKKGMFSGSKIKKRAKLKVGLFSKEDTAYVLRITCVSYFCVFSWTIINHETRAVMRFLVCYSNRLTFLEDITLCKSQIHSIGKMDFGQQNSVSPVSSKSNSTRLAGCDRNENLRDQARKNTFSSSFRGIYRQPYY